MKALKTPLLIGAAAIAAIGLAGAAVAEIKHNHVMEVRLPTGLWKKSATPATPRRLFACSRLDAYRLRLARGRVRRGLAFAAPERLSEQMDQEAAALLQQARSLPDPLDGSPTERLTQVNLGKLPRGMSGYSRLSTMSGGRVCTHTVRYGPSDNPGCLTLANKFARIVYNREPAVEGLARQPVG